MKYRLFNVRTTVTFAIVLAWVVSLGGCALFRRDATHDPRYSFSTIAGKSLALKQDLFLIRYGFAEYMIAVPGKWPDAPPSVQEYDKSPESYSHHVAAVLRANTIVRIDRLIDDTFNDTYNLQPTGTILSGPFRGKSVDVWAIVEGNGPGWGPSPYASVVGD